MTLLKPRTATGLRCARNVPSPSCPESFAPQHQTRPEPINAQVWLAPLVTAVALLVSPGTNAGLARDGCAATLPSWPRSFAPQHSTSPAFVSAQVWLSPAA